MPFYYHTHHRKLRPQEQGNRMQDKYDLVALQVVGAVVAGQVVEKVSVGIHVVRRP